MAGEPDEAPAPTPRPNWLDVAMRNARANPVPAVPEAPKEDE